MRPSDLARALAAAVRVLIGIDELLIVAGLVLATVGLWPVLHRIALIVPGAALLWIALPPRQPFIIAPAPPAAASHRRDD